MCVFVGLALGRPTIAQAAPVDDADRLWRRLGSVWSELTQAGGDAVLLRTNSLVTPACGLAGHGVTQARLALQLASTVAVRVTDQAVATRLSAGA